VSLGCENNTLEGFKEALGDYAYGSRPDGSRPEDTHRIAFLQCQEEDDEIEDGKQLLKKLAAYRDSFTRQDCPLSLLRVGLKCGGSDGMSGITANPLVGRAADMLIQAGGTALLSETPEMFGAEQIIMDRAADRRVFDAIVELVESFKDYYKKQGLPVYENPSPGNKAGGITTLEEKSCGCVQKGGSSPVMGVLKYGQRFSSEANGLWLLEGPGNDIVSTTALTAAGAQVILFTTGRGTPLGAPVPTIKIASNTALAVRKPAWIDFDGQAGSAGCGDEELFKLLLDTASGKQTKNEKNGYREIAIWKNGATL
jgi:altronate hydrolase